MTRTPPFSILGTPLLLESFMAEYEVCILQPSEVSKNLETLCVYSSLYRLWIVPNSLRALLLSREGIALVPLAHE